MRDSLVETVTGGVKTAIKISIAGWAGLLIYSYLTSEQTIYLPVPIMIISTVSVLLGGIQNGMSAASLGWLHGLMVAVFYAIILTVAKVIFFPGTGFDESDLMRVIILAGSGIIGGVAGINAKFVVRKKRRSMGY